jgi:hypothetical protein
VHVWKVLKCCDGVLQYAAAVQQGGVASGMSAQSGHMGNAKPIGEGVCTDVSDVLIKHASKLLYVTVWSLW